VHLLCSCCAILAQQLHNYYTATAQLVRANPGYGPADKERRNHAIINLNNQS